MKTNLLKPAAHNGRTKLRLFAVLTLLLSVFLFNSCKDEDDEEPNLPPVPPTNISATRVNDGIRISWDDMSDGDSDVSYAVYRLHSKQDDYRGNTPYYYFDAYYYYEMLEEDIPNTYWIDRNPQTGTNSYKLRTQKTGYEPSNYSSIISCVISNGSDPDPKPEGPTGGTAKGLYLGIIGFNESLNTKNISLLTENTASSFRTFVNNMTIKNATVLYYSVDEAINKLQAATLPSDLVNVSIVTFTDGLDQGSLELNSNYQNRPAYRNAVQERIKNTKIQGLDINAYSIGIKGNDVANESEFQENLNSLASSTANAIRVGNMKELTSKFSEVASSLYNESTSQTIELKIPGQEEGAKIRFTFDNVSNAANSSLYIEGTYHFSSKSLRNVVYVGMTSSSGTTVSGTSDGTVRYSYSFTDLKTNSGNTVPVNYIRQWEEYGSSRWQINSEFTPDNDINIIPEQKSAVIMLVLDCSSSLGSDFGTMQNAATAFINTLVTPQNTTNPGGGGQGGGNNNSFTETVNGVTFDMLAVDGGTFVMGATSEQGTDYDSDERPVHNVTLSDFTIGKYEVTQGLWKAVMGSYPGTAPSSSYGLGDNYPVYNISWNDATNFINKLNQLTGKTYRLPTEAEWEYAARGGKQSKGYKYSGSNTVGNVAWYSGNSGSISHSVGQKTPNELGIYDMSGNVWEWCYDRYGSYSSNSQTNPQGPSSGSNRVNRGGRWSSAAQYVRVSYRNYDAPDGRYFSVGFRLARSSQ